MVGCTAVLLSEWFAVSWRSPEDEGTTVRNADTCSPISTVSHTSPSSAKVRNEWSILPPSHATLLHAQGQLYLLPFFIQTGRAEILVNGNQIAFNITSW